MAGQSFGRLIARQLLPSILRGLAKHLRHSPVAGGMEKVNQRTMSLNPSEIRERDTRVIHQRKKKPKKVHLEEKKVGGGVDGWIECKRVLGRRVLAEKMECGVVLRFLGGFGVAV